MGHRRSDIRNFDYDSLIEVVEREMPPELPFEQAYDFSSYSIGELMRYASDPEVSLCDKYVKIADYGLWGQEHPVAQAQLHTALPGILKRMKSVHDKKTDLESIADLERGMQYILDRINVN